MTTQASPRLPGSDRAGFRRERLLTATVIVAVTVYLSVMLVSHRFYDLRVYQGAMRFWVHGGELYDYVMPPINRFGFTYPPFAALVMSPMAVVNLWVAIGVSIVLSLATAIVVMIWLVAPLARARGWSRWAAVTIALALVAALDSVQQTLTFGQINLIMLALVGVDFLVFLPASGRLRRWGGTGIGLAIAIKLTPGVFVLYLLVTRRWRDSGVALATFIVASLVGLAVAPHESVVFWSKALWQTGRVGYPDYIFNQSLRGLVARLNPAHPSMLLWTVLVLVSLAFWVYAVRRAGDDLLAGFALTGILGCLISPVTWVHHLVFLIPALVWLVQAALASGLGTRRGRVLIGVAALSYVVLISRVEELWRHHYGGAGGILGGSAYLWASLLLLVTVGLATGQDQQAMAHGSTRNGITSENPAPSTSYAQQPGPETNVLDGHSSGTPNGSKTTASPRLADGS